MKQWYQNKIIALLFAYMICLFGGGVLVVNAQDINSTIGDVDLVFCNSDNLLNHNRHLKIQVDPDESTDMCLEFVNTTSNKVSLKVNFVDGGMTADENARRACKNEISKEGFGQYVQGDVSTIDIPAKSSTKLLKTLNLPASKIGYNYGCVTYSVPNQQTTKKGGISYNVVVRKAGFIDAIVNGGIISKLDVLGPEGKHNVAYAASDYDSGFLFADSLGVKEFEDHLQVYTILKNNGNVPLAISGKGFMRTLIGANILLSSGNIVLLPNEAKEFTLTVPKPAWRSFTNKLSGDMLLHVPWYRMGHDIAINLEYVPDVQNDIENISDYSGNYHLTGAIFLMPWWLIIVITIVLMGYALKRLIRYMQKRREIDYKQKMELKKQ